MKKTFIFMSMLVASVVALAMTGVLTDGDGWITKSRVDHSKKHVDVAQLQVPYSVTTGSLNRATTVRKAHRAAAGLLADFSVQDGTSQVVEWSENFDNDARDQKGNLKLDGWTLDQGEGSVVTFTKEKKDFSTIDENDVYSLHIDGPYQVFKRTKASATSSEIAVPASGQLHAYVRMDKMWNEYVVLSLQVSDDNFETQTTLWQSSDVTTSGSHWEKIDKDISAFAGKNIRLRLYWGPGTKDAFNTGGYMGSFDVDGLSVTGVKTVDQVTVHTGEPVQLADLSTGNPTSWQWTFKGGVPETSTEQNPTVVYEQPGEYDITLSVSNANGTDEVTKTAFVVVEGQNPVAGVEWPSDFRDYQTRMRMVPPLATITYKDASEQFPSSYMWIFMSQYENTGNTIIPTVYYDKDQQYAHEKLNKYYVTHIVQNETGYDFVDDSVQVQFEGLVTNLRKNEYHTNFVDGDITLPGANKMGITAWAERISKPAQPVVLEAMFVNFTKASAEELYEQISPVTFALYTSENGLPGERIDILDTWNISELNYAMTNAGGAVELELSKQYVIDEEVFVVIEGIPEKNDNFECAFAMAPLRSEGNTAYMLKNGEWRPLTGFFAAAPGGQTSLAVYPYFSYSVLFKADVDPATSAVVQGENLTTVGAEAGEVEIPVFAYLGVAEYVGSNAAWCSLVGSPAGEYTVENVKVAFDALPAGVDSREAELTVSDGVQQLKLRVVQDRNATTAIKAVAASAAVAQPVYNLSGQQLSPSAKPRKGVFIVGGKKVIQ